MAANDIGTLTVQLPGLDRVFRLDEWVHSHIYSAVNLDQNQSATIDAFSYKRGQAVAGGTATANERHTNMPFGGALPNGWEILIFSHQFRFNTVTGASAAAAFPMADAQDIDSKEIIALRIGRNEVYAGPPSRFPQGGGPVFSGTVSNIQSTTNGIPDPRAKVAFLIPAHLREQKDFSVENRFPSALSLSANNQLVWHYLEGLVKRPIDTV